MNNCLSDSLEVLHKIRPNFSNRVLRHYQKTAQVLLDGLILTDCEKNIGDQYTELKMALTDESKQGLLPKYTFGLREFLKSLL